jgi:hypothetical protein
LATPLLGIQTISKVDPSTLQLAESVPLISARSVEEDAGRWAAITTSNGFDLIDRQFSTASPDPHISFGKFSNYYVTSPSPLVRMNARAAWGATRWSC